MQKGVETKPLYEVGYHLVPSIVEDEVGTEVARIREAIESRDGNVASEEWPKEMALAYGIEHESGRKRTSHDRAYFGWIRFEMGQEHITALEEALGSMDTVLRYIVVKVPRESTRPRKKRAPRSVLKKEPKTEEKPKEDTAAAEEIDREIEKLVSE